MSLKSIFNFWGIPLKYSENMIINDKEVLFEKKVLKLQINKKLKSSWIKDVNILFFKVYKSLGSEGEVLASFFDGKEKFPAIIQKDKKIIFNFDPEETISFLLNEKYFKKTRPIYTFLPFHYHKIPFRIALGRVQTIMRLGISSRFRHVSFPSWPIEGSVDVIRAVFLNSLKLIGEVKVSDFWPNGKKFAVVLTHDVDTKEGLKDLEMFSKIEEQAGFRSTCFIVGNYYKKDYKQLDKLVANGHEIGLHGYCHDNKLAYLPIKMIEERINECMAFIKKYDIKGFRSPSLLNSKNLEKVLQRYFLYDSTTPTTEKFLSDFDYGGCCSAFPYFKSNMLEIPLSISMDASLIFLGYSADFIIDIWIKQLDWIRSIGGVAVLNTHPDPHFSGNKKMLNVYRKFINHISSMDDAWVTTMSEIAHHWKKRTINSDIFEIS